MCAVLIEIVLDDSFIVLLGVNGIETYRNDSPKICDVQAMQLHERLSDLEGGCPLIATRGLVATKSDCLSVVSMPVSRLRGYQENACLGR